MTHRVPLNPTGSLGLLIPRNQMVSSAPTAGSGGTPGLVPTDVSKSAKLKAPEPVLSTVVFWGADQKSVQDLAAALASGLNTTYLHDLRDSETSEEAYQYTVRRSDDSDLSSPRVFFTSKFAPRLFQRLTDDFVISPKDTLIVEVDTLTGNQPIRTYNSADVCPREAYTHFLQLHGYAHLRVHPNTSAYMDSIFKLACIVYDKMALDVDADG